MLPRSPCTGRRACWRSSAYASGQSWTTGPATCCWLCRPWRCCAGGKPTRVRRPDRGRWPRRPPQTWSWRRSGSVGRYGSCGCLLLGTGAGRRGRRRTSSRCRLERAGETAPVAAGPAGTRSAAGHRTPEPALEPDRYLSRTATGKCTVVCVLPHDPTFALREVGAAPAGGLRRAIGSGRARVRLAPRHPTRPGPPAKWTWVRASRTTAAWWTGPSGPRGGKRPPARCRRSSRRCRDCRAARTGRRAPAHRARSGR